MGLYEQTDWQMLQKQKTTLVNTIITIHTLNLTEVKKKAFEETFCQPIETVLDDLRGLVHLIDALQDDAAGRGVA